MSRAVYIVGGRQKRDALSRDEWHRHRLATVVRLDVETRTADAVFDYESPADCRPDEDASILFKSATFLHDRCYLCTNTEVLVRALPDFSPIARHSLPWFNDVHHVQVAADGRMFVVSTGLDLVGELDPDGTPRRQWDVLGEPLWSRFSPETDYRKIPSTKPHRAHPNHLFLLDDDVWVTRLQQRDAVCLTRPGRRMAIDVQRPHDGLVIGDSVWFTTVDGHLVRHDRHSGERKEIVDLQAITGGLRKVGWCRGLAFLGPSQALVGFSRLRPTKWTDNVSWVGTGIQQIKAMLTHPARVALFDLERRRLVWEFPLDVIPDFHTVFSLHIREENPSSGTTP